MVECGGLENRFTGAPGDEGSNPSSSAILVEKAPKNGSFFVIEIHLDPALPQTCTSASKNDIFRHLWRLTYTFGLSSREQHYSEGASSSRMLFQLRISALRSSFCFLWYPVSVQRGMPSASRMLFMAR